MEKHLTRAQKTNLGGFYTPPHIVRLVYDLLQKHFVKDDYVLLDPACGTGAFFFTKPFFHAKEYIGVEIDQNAFKIAVECDWHVDWQNKNFLKNCCRSSFKIPRADKLIIVGNPPYNDITSQAKRGMKVANYDMDAELRTRDIGISFMRGFARLYPEYVAVLHPLSYLIKKANFNLLKPFMDEFTLLEAVVFSSSEFDGVSKASCFPIVAAVYKREEFGGTTYVDIWERKFQTLEGKEFSLSEFDYVHNYITKYPNKGNSPIKFYPMRDINALKRSRTFVESDKEGMINVDPANLPYYCYVDVFKDFAPMLPFYFGNMDIPINRKEFYQIASSFITISVSKHPTILRSPGTVGASFLRQSIDNAKATVDNYFKNLFKNHL